MAEIKPDVKTVVERKAEPKTVKKAISSASVRSRCYNIANSSNTTLFRAKENAIKESKPLQMSHSKTASNHEILKKEKPNSLIRQTTRTGNTTRSDHLKTTAMSITKKTTTKNLHQKKPEMNGKSPLESSVQNKFPTKQLVKTTAIPKNKNVFDPKSVPSALKTTATKKPVKSTITLPKISESGSKLHNSNKTELKSKIATGQKEMKKEQKQPEVTEDLIKSELQDPPLEKIFNNEVAIPNKNDNQITLEKLTEKRAKNAELLQLLKKKEIMTNINVDYLHFGGIYNITSQVSLEEENLFPEPPHKMGQALRELYKTVTLPRVAFLDQGTDFSISEYYIELELDNAWKRIQLEDIFIPQENNSLPKRLLIEGQPGYGKTTLTIKIIYDWAMQKDYVQQFDLAFWLPLRDLKEQNIQDGILEIAQQCDVKDRNYIQKVLTTNIASTLLVLDGFDELSNIARNSILKVLYKQQFREATIVLTCRTGLFNLQRNEYQRMFRSLAVKKDFWDRKIIIVGIEKHKRKEFLKKFILDSSATQVIGHLEHMTEHINELFKSPLFLLLLAFITQSEDSSVTCIKTKTELFKKLVNCIIRRSLERSGPASHDSFDIFNFNDPVSGYYQKKLQEFGDLAAKNIIANTLTFPANDEKIIEIYNLGLLVNHQKIGLFNSTTYFEAFHLSLLEFLAAFSIWHSAKSQQLNFTKPIINRINTIFIQSGETSLVLPFLIGLLEEEAPNFFKQMENYSHLYSAKQEGLWHMIHESQNPNHLVKTIRKFLPPNLDYGDIYQKPFFKLVNLGITNNRILHIDSTADHPEHLPKMVKIPFLSIDKYCGEESAQNVFDFKLVSQIQCRFLFLVVRGVPVKPPEDQGNCDKIFQLLSTIDAIKRAIKCDSSIAPWFLHSVDRGLLSKVVIDYLKYEFKEDNLEIGIELIRTLIKKELVKAMRLIFWQVSALNRINDIIEVAPHSKLLESFHLDNKTGASFDVDFDTLTKCGQKVWKHVGLYNIGLIANSSQQKNYFLESLDIFSGTKSSEALSKMSVSLLKCDACLLKATQCLVSSSWEGYTTLLELDLRQDKTSNEIEFWNGLINCFSNLTVLRMHVLPEGWGNPPIPILISCLLSLPIKQLLIWGMNFNFSYVKTLAGHLLLMLPAPGDERRCSLRNVILQSFAIGSDEKDDEDGEIDAMCETMVSLLDCLKSGSLKKIGVISSFVDLWPCIIKRKIIDENIFTIHHDIVGSQEYDSAIDKMSLDPFLEVRNRFIIDKK